MSAPRKALLLAAAAAAALGCRSAPVKEPLDTYLERFGSMKASAEDLYLQTSVAAGELGSAQDVLAQRRAALEARLEALRLVDRYNRALTGIASGMESAALRGHVQSLGRGLSSFRTAGSAALGAASVMPYFGVVAKGAAVVQDLMAKRRYRQAVREAQAPIGAILDILAADSASIEEVLAQRLRREQDPYRSQLDAIGGRLYRRLKTIQPDEETGRLLARINEERRGAGRPEVPHEPAPEAAAATGGDLEDLAVLLDGTEANALSFRRVEERLGAQKAVFERYRAALEAVRGSFAALNRDSEEQRKAATGAFNRKAMELREENVKLREAR